MDQMKIGKFIATCRKEKKLTQSQLAEKLNVTDRSVSKWETGKCMPDLSLFKPLCDELGITLTEFINGEKISNNDLKEKSDLTLKNTIEYTNKKISKGKKIIILITITFSIIFLFLLVFLN